MNPENFPISVGQSLSEVRREFGPPAMEGRDESLEDMGLIVPKSERKVWRDLLYMSVKPSDSRELKSVSVNLRFQYRKDNGVVWSARVMDTWKVWNRTLYGLNNQGKIGDFLKTLGKPSKQAEESPSLASCWWVKDDLGFHLRIYTRDFPDVGVTHYAGEAQWIYVCSLKLGPAGVRSWFS
jgi:hypothetical protein